MLGLEYALKVFNKQHNELASELGIKKQNINLWLRGTQRIPAKYLPALERIFGIQQDYFQQELSDTIRFKIEREKIKQDIEQSRTAISSFDESGHEYDSEYIPGDLLEMLRIQNINLMIANAHDDLQSFIETQTEKKVKLLSAFLKAANSDMAILILFKMLKAMEDEQNDDVFINRIAPIIQEEFHKMQKFFDELNGKF